MKRVLIAEDEPIVRFIIGEALADAGFEVLSVSDGRAALTLIEDPDAVSIVVTDFHMPGADGLEVVEGARQRHPNLPVVVMTGRIDLLTRKRSSLQLPSLRSRSQCGNW